MGESAHCIFIRFMVETAYFITAANVPREIEADLIADKLQFGQPPQNPGMAIKNGRNHCGIALLPRRKPSANGIFALMAKKRIANIMRQAGRRQYSGNYPPGIGRQLGSQPSGNLHADKTGAICQFIRTGQARTDAVNIVGGKSRILPPSRQEELSLAAEPTGKAESCRPGSAKSREIIFGRILPPAAI